MFRKLLQLSLCVAVGTSFAPAFAAPGDFNCGVQAYSTRQYELALQAFRRAQADDPYEPLIHYYIGLSLQGLNHLPAARKEYQYVAQTAQNTQLRSQAQAAATQIDSYLGSSAPGMAVPGQSQQVIARQPEKSMQGRLHIIEFYTDW